MRVDQVGRVERGGDADLLLGATQEVLRTEGLSGVTVAAVLARTELGTRAFYRHFSSKDHLLVEVFAHATTAEVHRLRVLMNSARTAEEAVAAWINGRLDLGFDDEVESDLRYLSEQAQMLYRVAPETMTELSLKLMKPLVEQIQKGIDEGHFVPGDAWFLAESIASVVWSRVEVQWTAPSRYPAEARDETLAFCLRGLGISPAVSSGDGGQARSVGTERGLV